MSNFLDNLNTEQKQAVTHTKGPLLIVAGAGTGKTTVITRRIAYLAEQKLAEPSEVLALTFTEKAAGEMKERTDLLLDLGFTDLWISTFHGFCERILKNHALDIGLPADFQLLDEVGQWTLMFKNFDKLNLDYYRPLGNPSRFISALLKHFSKCKDEQISPEDYLLYAQNLRLNQDTTTPVRQKKPAGKNKAKTEEQQTGAEEDLAEILRVEEVAKAYHLYQKILLDNNFLDFGDLINFTLQLFTKRPKILSRYQNKFKYIMVDEFQDTNYAQYQLVKILSGQSGNVAVVGDDDQSIYKFRGASVSNILKFKEDFPGFKQVALLENYRSSQNILDLAYSFIQANNPDRLEIKLGIGKKLKAMADKKPGKIEVLAGSDLQEELNLVVKKIAEIKLRDKLGWNDFAVLMRSNSSADSLLPVLESAGIPYTFLASKGLYKKPIVLDVLAYFKLLLNAFDSKSLYRVLNLPKFFLPHREVSQILHHAHKKTLSVFESLKELSLSADLAVESRKTVSKLLFSLESHHQMLKDHSAAEVAVSCIRDAGLDQKLSEDTLENAQSREYLEQFYKKILDFQNREPDHSLKNFLDSLDLEIQAGSEGALEFDPQSGPESVKVMTVHSSKGLEFENVFVVNMVDQRFPTREKGEAIEIPEQLVKDILPEGDFHLQEERRLFYVAATRAKSGLYFSWARDYGGQKTKKPSQFLVECGLVEEEKSVKATGQVFFSSQGKKKEVYVELPAQFSFSQLTDFETCPLKYKYRHYLKLPTPGSHHLSFGSTIHKVFEEFLKLYKQKLESPQLDLFGQGQKDPLPEFSILENFYEKYWIDDWYENKTQKAGYKKDGQKMLAIFYDSLKNLPKPKYIEQFFKIKLGDFDFVGKIDRADQAEGGLKIIDYKTGKVPKNKKDLDQLYIYQWAAEEFLREKVQSLEYWYLGSNERKPEDLASKQEIIELKAKLLDLIEKIRHTTKYDLFSDLHRKIPDHKCEYEDLEEA